MKKIVFMFVAFGLLSCAEMQQVMAQLPQGTSVLSQGEIGNGLKEALNNGISKQVSKLTATDGFFKNEAVKIKLFTLRTKRTSTMYILNLLFKKQNINEKQKTRIY